MSVTRRPAEVSRALLIEAAVDVIKTEGYAALTARRLAEKVGLKRQIVHYYFGTADDLLLAVVRYYGDSGLKRFAEAFKSQHPLRVLWSVEADASATTFAFMAMATHRPVIRTELRRYLDKFRRLQVEAISDYFDSHGLKPSVPPIAAAIIIQTVSQGLAAEAALGAVSGHTETRAFIEKALLSLAKQTGSKQNSGRLLVASRPGRRKARRT
jgi:AcrR family transcriptional regulator